MDPEGMIFDEMGNGNIEHQVYVFPSDGFPPKIR